MMSPSPASISNGIWKFWPVRITFHHRIASLGAAGSIMTAEDSVWVRDARASIKNADTNFFQVKPSRYWIDFLISATLAYSAAGIYLTAPLFSLAQIIAFPFAVFWLYRSGSLIHEVAHLPSQELRAFKITWNLVVGVITLAPSTFFTAHHREHHSGKMYGTPQDPEYVVNVFKRGSPLSILFYGLHICLFPGFVFLRFLLAPLSFIHPKIRDFTLRRLSSFTLNWKYEKNLSRLNRKTFVAIELLCWLRASAILIGVAVGISVWTRIPLMYLLGASTLMFNQMRQLADHHFESDGDRMSVPDHILDSCNYTGRDFFTWLFFPFAIKFHALHHLFPSLPYHNLKAAHEHLTLNLPVDSPYHGLSQPGWWNAASVTFAKRPEPASVIGAEEGGNLLYDGPSRPSVPAPKALKGHRTAAKHSSANKTTA
jgi:fatty acid desaturase